MTPTVFAKGDIANYPFLRENTEYVRRLNLRVEDLTRPEFERIVDRAEERVQQAVLYAIVDRQRRNEEIEILSFPVALMLAIATKSQYIRKRYALAEAKRTFEDLKDEKKERITDIAEDVGLALTADQSVEAPFEFSLDFADYLRSAVHLRDKKWKLVNRHLSKGNVSVTRSEAARLISEEVRKHIDERLEVKELPSFPEKILRIAERVRKLSDERFGKEEFEEVPKVMVETAFPPCIGALYLAFSSGRHLSHIGRFALTSFLINVGMSSDKLIELFKNISDFNEKMTRYQVEHIAGETGSRTRYIPPKCDTLKTHGVCMNPDQICERIRHPLSYYRIKLRSGEKTL